MSILIGLFIGMFVIGPFVIWITGGFNPIGHLGTLPWRVPRCERCGRKTGVGHQCAGRSA